ncbi:MAG: hypothetical protein ACNA7Q_15300, partial [Rhodobacterales bacterium]
MPQQELGIGPACILVTDPVFNRDADIIKEHLTEVMRPCDQADRAHRNPRRFEIDQQKGNAHLRLDLGVSAQQRKNP